MIVLVPNRCLFFTLSTLNFIHNAVICLPGFSCIYLYCMAGDNLKMSDFSWQIFGIYD